MSDGRQQANLPKNRKTNYGDKKKKELSEKRKELDKAKSRIREIDGIIQKLYGDNAIGKINNDRFATMSMSLETELEDAKSPLKAYSVSLKRQRRLRNLRN